MSIKIRIHYINEMFIPDNFSEDLSYLDEEKYDDFTFLKTKEYELFETYLYNNTLFNLKNFFLDNLSQTNNMIQIDNHAFGIKNNIKELYFANICNTIIFDDSVKIIDYLVENNPYLFKNNSVVLSEFSTYDLDLINKSFFTNGYRIFDKNDSEL